MDQLNIFKNNATSIDDIIDLVKKLKGANIDQGALVASIFEKLKFNSNADNMAQLVDVLY